jgi:YhcH/YjgK/YiaL family protein
MILDTISNFSCYTPLHPEFAAIRRFLQTISSTSPATGKHSIRDTASIAGVDEYITKPQDACVIECHRRFIDIQIVLHGRESVGYYPITSCKELSEYDAEKDVQKLRGPLDFITLESGVFAVFFPQDGHMPQVQAGEIPEMVKKMVIKIPVAQIA